MLIFVFDKKLSCVYLTDRLRLISHKLLVTIWRKLSRTDNLCFVFHSFVLDYTVQRICADKN